MSTALVHEKISMFLCKKDAEVLCIRGKWGVGKTYAWNKLLTAELAASRISLPRYSYVSLFGINSLDELKLAIFENTVVLQKGELKANLETLDAYISSIGSWRKIAQYAQSVPLLKSIVNRDNSALLSFLTIRGQIVCIDDLERKGKKLGIRDVLGLASFLREQRECKVIFLFNDEELNEEDQKELNSHIEKVADASLVYDPTTDEAIGIALPNNDEISLQTKEYCSKLGISNIRVINKIKRYISDAKKLTEEYDATVFKQVSASIALFAWSYLQPSNGPSIEFLTTKKSRGGFGLKDTDFTAEEASWNALLDSYGYSWTDELDFILLGGIRSGYFNKEAIKPYAEKLHKQAIAAKADGSFTEAWQKYHHSFANNQDEVLDGLYKSFMKNYEYISPLNLNGTVSLFKELGRTDQALEMLSFYVSNRTEGRKLFDFSEYAFSDDISDEDVRKAFEDKVDQIDEVTDWDLSEALGSLRKTWSDSLMKRLAEIPVETYVQLLKATEGPMLRRILAGGLSFSNVVNATEDMTEFTRRFKEALWIIGTESPINARRVARYGVKIEG